MVDIGENKKVNAPLKLLRERTKSKIDKVTFNTRESDSVFSTPSSTEKKKRNGIIKRFHTFYGSIL